MQPISTGGVTVEDRDLSRAVALEIVRKARGQNVEVGYVEADQYGPILVNGKVGEFELNTIYWNFHTIQEAKPVTNIG